MPNRESESLQIRSEEVRDILSRPPNWMLLWGSTVLLLLVVLGLLLSYVIKYPDVIIGRALVSTNIPPVFVESKVNGRVTRINIQHGQNVMKGDIISEIASPISKTTISKLNNYLDSCRKYIDSPENFNSFSFENLTLLEAGVTYFKLTESVQSYLNYSNLASHKRRVDLIEKRVQKYESLQKYMENEDALTLKTLKNDSVRFEMQKLEYQKGLIPKIKFLESESSFNESLKSKGVIRRRILEAELELEALKAEIESINRERQTTLLQYKNTVKEHIVNLSNFISQWENDYIIKAPINGRLDYLNRFTLNQLINTQDRLFAIIPQSEQYEVLVELPAQGFGKIEVGQKVRLKIDNYPYQEFGFLNGKVHSIYSLPQNEEYQIRVKIDDGLTTSINRKLNYRPEMKATAEVTTEDLRLIDRFFGSLKSILAR